MVAAACFAFPRTIVRGVGLPREGRARIVLADELTLMREGLAALCASTGYLDVVGQSADGWQAMSQIEQTRPDIAFLDIQLPGLHAIEILKQIRAQQLPTRAAVLSSRGDRKTVIEALRGGAGAFLLKSCPVTDLLDSIEQMLGGGVYISPALKPNEIFLSDDNSIPDDPFQSLSPREFQVFGLLVAGDRPKIIAGRLGLSPKTVDTYRASLMQKLGIHDVAGLVKYALQRNLIA